ncbi:MAG: DNA helicase PcrA [Clostridiales bacterium]|nr:DNA helicase PcrA [Clostridiales bacterium]
MDSILEKLNEKQREAVTTTEGPVLIVAGAGSGKTTVLVNRIAYILQKRLATPHNILAITFTNKAANEMKERISDIVGEKEIRKMWVGTFHSICVRILRGTIDFLGYDSDFVIYDTADVKTLMKEIYREEDIDDKNYPIKYVTSTISNAKNELMDAATFEEVNRNDYRMSTIARIYKKYQQKLLKNNALDFDDIILNTVKILSLNEDVLIKYQARFSYIFVDEYQDTNIAQYTLVNLIASAYKNICVVGDDDQSIYKFRGANVGNILSFEEDYPDAARITLDQNYRSTQTILDAANAVIGNNGKRMGKNLWTANGEGNKIKACTAQNEYDEARFVAKEISKHCKNGGSFSDCAVLYRTNAQSRVIEEAFMREAIPYRVLAGLRFYDRKEIKDIIAYLRIIHNPNDDISLKRIINEPKRKIGAATMEKAQNLANEAQCSVYDIIKNAGDYPALKSAAQRLLDFCCFIENMSKLAGTLSLVELIKRVLNDSGYIAMLTLEPTIENQTRVENLNEFLNVAAEFENSEEEDKNLALFLENISLISDIDAYDEDEDTTVMMTIHSAKGLEFPIVFMVGLEEGLFPGTRSIGDAEEIEEERRLCYVAITRAKEQLYITKARSRTIYGKTAPALPSRFYGEIPREYIEDVSGFGTKVSMSLEQFGVRIEPGKPHPKGKQTYCIDFKPGDKVEHEKFGRGVVVSSKRFGNDAIVNIAFDSIGPKQLMAVFAKLKKID